MTACRTPGCTSPTTRRDPDLRAVYCRACTEDLLHGIPEWRRRAEEQRRERGLVAVKELEIR